MKNTILAILTTLNFFVCYAEITPVENMKEVFDVFTNADAKTLAVFDVDMVLVQPSDPAFQMPNMKHYSAIAKRIIKELPSDKQMMFFSLMTTGSDPILIDEKTPQFLDQLMQRGIPAIALTANLTGEFGSIPNMEQWRVNGLKHFGIDFSRTAPYKSPLLFNNLSSYRDNFSAYLEGVLIVNGTVVSKGEAFISFLDKSGFHPNKVIFVDDREENLKNLEEALQKFDSSIEYQGFHYTGAQKYPSKAISEEEFESSWQKLANEAISLH